MILHTTTHSRPTTNEYYYTLTNKSQTSFEPERNNAPNQKDIGMNGHQTGPLGKIIIILEEEGINGQATSLSLIPVTES